MTAPELTLAELLARLRNGDNAAAEECFDKFARRLIALAQSRLSANIRQKTDPEDVVQSVFSSFFLRTVKGNYEITDWGGLWRMLVTITIRKCCRRAEYFGSGRRNVRLERTMANTTDDDLSDWELVAGEPTPLQALIIADEVEQLLAPFDHRSRQILSLRLQGFEIAEISTQVGRSERTIFRVLERARESLHRIRLEN